MEKFGQMNSESSDFESSENQEVRIEKENRTYVVKKVEDLGPRGEAGWVVDQYEEFDDNQREGHWQNAELPPYTIDGVVVSALHGDTPEQAVNFYENAEAAYVLIRNKEDEKYGKE